MSLCVLTFLLGDLVIQQLGTLPSFKLLLLLAALTILPVYKRYWSAVCFLAGLLWAGVFGHWQLAGILPDDYQNKNVMVEGYIASLPEQQDNRSSFDFTVTKPASGFPEKIRLSWYHPPQALRAGESWRLNVKLKKPYGRLNPGGFDYEAWLFANNIGATGYVHTKPAPAVIESTAGLAQNFARFRQAISDRLDLALPESSQLGIIKALTIGSQNAISQTQWDVFNFTGTTHLIVISGSHISLVAGLVYLLVRRGWAWLGILAISPQRVAACAAWLAALCYAGLAGYSVPTLRAIIMLSVALGAIYWQRHTSPLQVLMLALLAVLLYDPLAVLSVGFWFSFAAVGLLIYISAGRLGKSPDWRQLISSQLAVAVGLSPLLIVFFQKVSLISPAANWLATPVIEILIVPLALLSILLLYLAPTLASILLSLNDLILQGLWRLLSAMADLPLASIYCLQPPWYALPLAGVGVLLLLAPKGFPARYLGSLLFLPLFIVAADKPEPGNVWLSVLDVGQGLSAVMQTANHTLVFDTGAKFSEESDMGDAVLLPFLHWQGVQQINTLIISHNDNDHSGGAASLLKNMPVEHIVSSAPEWTERESGQYCRAGQNWEWDQVKFTLLSPPETGYPKENDNSCVLKVDTGKNSFLLTGDIEQTAEQWLVEQYGGQLNSSVLVAAHHGSKTSSSLNFLQQVTPQLTVIPAGHLNRFGFPHKQVLARYRQLNLPWLTTGEQGAIRIRSEAGDLRVESERKKRKRYWMTE